LNVTTVIFGSAAGAGAGAVVGAGDAGAGALGDAAGEDGTALVGGADDPSFEMASLDAPHAQIARRSSALMPEGLPDLGVGSADRKTE